MELFHSVGKNRFSNIFWLKNRWNKLLFFDIDVGEDNPDFLTLMLIKDWELFYERNRDREDLSILLGEYIEEISQKYQFVNKNEIKSVLAVIDSNGADYFSYNYDDILEIEIGEEKLFICGVDKNLIDTTKPQKLEEVYDIVESEILKIEDSSIPSVNKYAFMFRLGNFDVPDVSDGSKYKFVDILDKTGIIKFFELSTLKYIINVSFDKIAKTVDGFEENAKLDLLRNIKIVLREIIINSIEHGLENSVCGTVYFHYYYRNNRVVFTVEDSGKGFQYDMRTLDEESRRGKGLHLIDNIVDDIYFNENGNLVRVEFNLDRWRKNDF